MIENLLGRIGSALKAARIPYMVIGGQAVLLYGEPRMTRDIDVSLGIRGILSVFDRELDGHWVRGFRGIIRSLRMP